MSPAPAFRYTSHQIISFGSLLTMMLGLQLITLIVSYPPPPPTPTPPQVWVEIDLLGLAETGGLSLRTRRVKQSSFGSAALANASVDFGMNRLVETRRGGQARALLEASYSPTLPMYITPTRTL